MSTPTRNCRLCNCDLTLYGQNGKTLLCRKWRHTLAWSWIWLLLIDLVCLTISHVNGSVTFYSSQMFFRDTVSSKYIGCSMLLHLMVEILTNQQRCEMFWTLCHKNVCGLLSTRTKHSNWWIYYCFQRQVFRQNVQSNETHKMGVARLRSRRLSYRLHLLHLSRTSVVRPLRHLRDQAQHLHRESYCIW